MFREAGTQAISQRSLTETVDALRAFLTTEGRVKFGYLFGSLAHGNAGPLSDVDVAVFLDGRLDFFTFRLKLMEAMTKVLKTENFDLVVLNKAPVVLAHEVISGGIILKDDRPRRVIFESRVLREYLDTAHLRDVQRSYLKEQMRRGDFLYQVIKERLKKFEDLARIYAELL